jgi:hypothetical protein
MRRPSVHGSARRRRATPWASVPALAAVVAAALVLACTPPRVADAPVPPADPTRMPHDRHRDLPCDRCHRGDARPGAADHQPCDDGRCHQTAFLAPPSLFCSVCHRAITTAPLVAPLRPYPSEDAWQALPSRFAHATHLDAARLERAVGFHVGCVDCHLAPDGTLAAPGHAVCARCHAGEAGLTGAPTMQRCGDCHPASPSRPRSRARLIRDDLHFTHDRHRVDRRGQSIRCEACHEASARAVGYDDHDAPRVESCVGCHDDAARTPATARMRTCETCHATRTSSLTSIAPRNHLPATERPLDHTLAFRRDHGDAAADAARCAGCHTQMSGNPRQACDECHQTMAPADHRVTWRELDHGSEAAAERDRCARCHVVEFCTACHRQRPRSHVPLMTFAQDHGALARINPRACLTCHDPDRDCLTCHRDQGRVR